MTTSADASMGQSGRQLAETVGLILFPVAIAVCALDLGVAIASILVHLGAMSSPSNTFGVTPARKGFAVLALSLLGLVGPIATCFLVFDWAGTGLDRRRRLSLAGWLVTPIALLALVGIGSFPHQL